MPPPTLRCCATESDAELELFATHLRRDIDEDFNRSREAERRRSREADRSLPPIDDVLFKSMESINSFTWSSEARRGADFRDILEL